jgi:hypothetical protein
MWARTPVGMRTIISVSIPTISLRDRATYNRVEDEEIISSKSVREGISLDVDNCKIKDCKLAIKPASSSNTLSMVTSPMSFDLSVSKQLRHRSIATRFLRDRRETSNRTSKNKKICFLVNAGDVESNKYRGLMS